MFSLPSCYSIMNGIHSTCIIFLNGLLSLFICRCDSGTINIHLSKQNVTGSLDDLTGTCNVTGLLRNKVGLTDTCNSSPVLAWVGAYATYSPWIEYKGCGIFKFTASLIQIDFTQKNFSVEPDMFKCFEHCQMQYIRHNYIGFQRNRCLCFYNVDIEIEQCNNTNITECGDNQNFICGDKDNVTVIYEIKNQVIMSKNNTGECGIVNINNNQTTFSSMECSNKAEILCVDNGTLKVYHNKTEKWKKAVQICQKQDWLISSVENIMNGSLLNVTDGTYWVSAVRGISYTSLNDDNVECGIVNIKDNKTTFSSMACSNNATILCFKNRNYTYYPNQRANWEKSVQFCRTQDGSISSVENITGESLLHLPDGTYWVSAIRGIYVQDPDNDFCVASFIEDGTKMTPTVYRCDLKLPVTCRSGSSDLWDRTSRECITSGNDITSTNSYTTTNMANVSVFQNERNLIIIIVSGSIGFVVLVLVVIILICKRRKRTLKTENVQSNFHEKTVKHELYAEVLPEVEYKNNSETINIYDHTDTSQIPTKFDTNLPSEYDSMAGIKQEAEGLYDESATCPSGNTQTKEMDGLYDHC